MAEEQISTNELARAMREYRQDTSKALHDMRNEMTVQTGKLELGLIELGNSMAKGYVGNQLWEEVRRNQGERIGHIDIRLTKLEEQSQSRYESAMAKIQALDESIEDKFEEKERAESTRLKEREREVKADRRLIFTALVAPFIMLILGILISLVVGTS